jgi:hypothetical protein
MSKPAVVKQSTQVEEAAADAHGLHTAIPKYAIYAQFLTMVQGMDESGLVAAFRLKWLGQANLAALRDEATTLARELVLLDTRAQKLVAGFRRIGRLALRDGKSLPPAPAEIYRLQALRTAVMVNHAVSLQAKLGRKNMMEIEAMLAYQFTPQASFSEFALQ